MDVAHLSLSPPVRVPDILQLVMFTLESLPKWLASLGFGAIVGYFIASKTCNSGSKSARSEMESFDSQYPSPQEGFDSKEACKMVLVVNMALKMGKGKLAAQCAHGALAVYELATQSRHEEVTDVRAKSRLESWRKWVDVWEEEGVGKIVLKVQSDKEMLELAKSARSKGLPAVVIADAGHTQIAAGSRTVLAIGPAPKSLLDTVTGNLKLM